MNHPIKTTPPMAAAKNPTTSFRTGSWRFERPVFVERIAPCSEACPVGIDIPVTMSLMEMGKFEEAYYKILRENPFPGICGQVCFHPCERVCNRGRFDQAVSIRDLEKFVSHSYREASFNLKAPETNSGEKVAVVGSDPAGLSCAYFLARLGHQVTIIEAGANLEIFMMAQEEEKLSRELLEWEVEQIMSLGIELRTNTPTDAYLIEGLASEFKAVYVSPKALASDIVRMGKSAGKSVYSTQELFSRIKTDNPPDLSDRTVIIGGGKRTFDAAWAVKKLGYRPVVFYHSSPEEVPISTNELDRAERSGIEFQFQTSIFGLIEEAGQLKGLLCSHIETDAKKVSRYESPKPPTKNLFEIQADHVIIALDIRGNQGLMVPWFHNSGILVIDESSGANSISTSRQKDSARPSRTTVRGIASGKQAALVLDMSLHHISFDLIQLFALGRLGSLSLEAYQGIPAISQIRQANQVVRFQDLNPAHFKKSSRITPPTPDSLFTKRQALLSAKRCFKCGICTFCYKCYEYCPDLAIQMDGKRKQRTIDYDYCKGCGICAQECPRGAIIMKKE